MADREEVHFISDADAPAPIPPAPKKRGFTIWRLMIAVAVVAFLFGVVRPAFLVFDALSHGPFTVAYNRDCQRLADEARLIGKPESEVIKVLGEPTSVWEYDHPDGWTKTFNYAPVSFVSSGKFQVHCRDGVVKILEQLDD